LAAHPQYDAVSAALAPNIAASHPAATALQRALSSQGQTFLDAAGEVLERPETQEVVSHTLNAIGRYFSGNLDWNQVDQPLCDSCQTFAPKLESVARLARCDDSEVKAIFARSTAIGSLMRRKIEPVTATLLRDIAELRR
jgi:hypothetical protein